MNRTTRGALQALGAAFLLAMLVFLFVKTAGMDVKHDTHALSLLREMKDLDSRWDEDVLRMANDFSGAAPRADFPLQMGRILSDLERSGPGSAFGHDLAQLRAGLGDKDAGRPVAARRAPTHARSVAGSGCRAATAPAARRSASHAIARGARSHPERARRASCAPTQLSPSTLSRGVSPRCSSASRRCASNPSPSTRPWARRPAARKPRAARSSPRAKAELAALAQVSPSSRWAGASTSPLRTLVDVDGEHARREGPLARLPLRLRAGAAHRHGLPRRCAWRSTQAQLRNANESLEKRVSERTRDLSRDAQAPAGIRGPARSVGEDVVARPDGGGRRARDQLAARVREEQRRHGARPHAGPA